jgi:NADPH:quinone reductase-like Zn-dependent oxidoreductase
VRSIGADHVIDYTREDFSKNGQRYDLIYDAVGNLSVAASKRALTPRGTCVVAGFTTLARLFQVILLGSWVSKTGDKKIGLMATAKSVQSDLVFIKELLEAGKIVPVIDRSYPLSETAEAIRYLEQGHARGKVIISVAQDN